MELVRDDALIFRLLDTNNEIVVSAKKSNRGDVGSRGRIINSSEKHYAYFPG